MADLNNGKGKFWGVDSSVKYADSFKGATKVAEKVKKGGTESKPDGYVVDAIDIDWGGLKLTTIDNGWSQKTVSSIEQNAGKGENTQGIHSTAYLLNLISSSFTQIYNEIGGNDNAGLRKKIQDLDSAIKQITGSDPGQLANIRDRIQKIEQELDNPGAASTLVTILDTLDGFDKNNKGDVKKYIDDHDKAILGTPTDEATAYSVYGVRKYVDTTAQDNLIGKKGNKWPAQKTLYGVVEYVDTTAKNRLIGTSTDTTIDTHYGLKHILIGNTADTTIDTHWGVKNSLIGTASDNKDSNTIKGAKKYADGVQSNLLGKEGNEWPLQKTMYGLAKYADTKLKGSLLGKEGDKWDAQKTLYGIVKYVDTTAKENLIGTSTDTTIDTHYGLKNILIGKSTDASTADTIWGIKKSVTEAINAAASDAAAKDEQVKIDLRGSNENDNKDSITIWGARKHADEIETVVTAQADEWSRERANTAKNDAIKAAASDAAAKDEQVKIDLIGKSTDASTADTIWGAKNYANTTVKNSLLGATSDQWPNKQTIWGVKNSLIGTANDHDDSNTIWGAKNYAKNQISVKKYNQLTAQVIEENGEGILKLLTVSSYLG